LINLLCLDPRCLRRGTQIFMITETLWLGHLTFPALISDSALKSCIYYPVCRYQRTSGSDTLGDKKTQLCLPTRPPRLREILKAGQN
jgi:hypothetical protein